MLLLLLCSRRRPLEDWKQLLKMLVRFLPSSLPRPDGRAIPTREPCANKPFILLYLCLLWTNVFAFFDVRDEASQRQLIDLCKAVGEHISSLVQAVRNSVTNHSNPAAQLELINESLAMIPVSLFTCSFPFPRVPGTNSSSCNI